MKGRVCLEASRLFSTSATHQQGHLTYHSMQLTQTLPYLRTSSSIQSGIVRLNGRVCSLLWHKKQRTSTKKCNSDCPPLIYPIPIHWRATINQQLYTARGIMKPVEVGEPVILCSPMVVVRKADGPPRQIVDFQGLHVFLYQVEVVFEKSFLL